jgi:hypothetical protein
MSHIPPLSKVRRTLAHLRELVADLDDDTVTELHRRAQLVAQDGYTSGSSAGRGSHGGDVADPTYAAAVRPEPFDPVRKAVAEIFAGLAEATGVLRGADRRRRYVFAAGDAERGRQSSLAGDCGACGRAVAGTEDDKLCSGYCSACRKAWERADYPERGTFERERRSTIHQAGASKGVPSRGR